MKKILGSIVLYILFTLIAQAGSVTATVDSPEVVEGDTLLLTITVVGENVERLPDIEEINGLEVESIQRRSGSSFVYVNGNSTMQHSETLMLEIRPTKDMTIPSFSLKTDGKIEKTAAIAIKVVTSPTGAKREDKNFSLEMKVNKVKVYLGEPILVTVYFKQKSNANIISIEYTPPKFKAFFSKQLEGEKTYKKGEQTIHELTYLLVAKKEGIETIDAAHAKIAQRSRSQQRGGWYLDRPEWSRISSSALSLEVLAPTLAHDILGHYKLKDSIDTIKVKPNKPVNLKIELEGEGSLEDYEGIAFEIPNVTIYGDDAKVSSQIVGKKFYSRYEKSFVFISDHNFTIPSKEIRVYDYNKEEVTILKTKAYNIEVEGSSSVATVAMVHTQKPVTVQSTVQKVQSEPFLERLPSFMALILAFLLGGLTMFLLRYVPKISLNGFGNTVKFNRDEALKILYPHMGKSAEVEAMVRDLYAVKRGNTKIKIDKLLLKELLEKYSV